MVCGATAGRAAAAVVVARLNVRATALQAAAACGYVSATSGQREAVHVVMAESAVEVAAVACGGAVATWVVVYASEALAAAMASPD